MDYNSSWRSFYTISRHIIFCFLNIPDYPLSLKELQLATQTLADQAFWPRMKENHMCQAKVFTEFCRHYHQLFINLTSATVCYYITFFTKRFTCLEYDSFTNKQLVLDAPKLDSFTVTCLLRAVTLASRPSAPALHHITPAAAGRPT